MIDISKAAKALQKIADAGEMLRPIAKGLGGPTVDSVVALINTGASIGGNLLERIADGTVVADSRDTELVKAILADLQGLNDKLNDTIVNS